jgi:hypothetical protein
MNAAPAPEPVDISAFSCRKCEGKNLGRNGAQIRNGRRFQRLICRNCKYIWVEYSLPLSAARPTTPDLKTSNPTAPSPKVAEGMGLPVAAHNSVPETKATETDTAQVKENQVSTSRMERPAVNTSLTDAPLQSANAGHSTADAPMFPTFHTTPTLPFRRLELDALTDWSPSGVLAYTQHAQHALQQALAQFEHPAMAELELQGLEPRIRAYVKARQAFETALMLQWAAVFTGSGAYPAMTNTTNSEWSNPRPRASVSTPREPVSSSSTRRDQTSSDETDDPEHPGISDRFENTDITVLRAQLEAFKQMEQTWRFERLRHKQELQLLELDRQQLVTKWSRVKQHYEGLKIRFRNGEVGDGNGIQSVIPMSAKPAQPLT